MQFLELFIFYCRLSLKWHIVGADWYFCAGCFGLGQLLERNLYKINKRAANIIQNYYVTAWCWMPIGARHCMACIILI